MEYIIAYLIIGLFVFIYSVKQIDNYLEFGVVNFKLIGLFLVAFPWILLLLMLRLGVKVVAVLSK